MQKDTSFWFYTWQDCDLIYASRTEVSKYCSGPKDCARYEPGPTDLGAQLKLMGGLYQQFRKDTGAWQVCICCVCNRGFELHNHAALCTCTSRN